MKVHDIITKMDGDILINQILAKYKNFPVGSITPREVVQGLDFKVQSREEAEALVAELNATVTSAILNFQVKQKR